MTSSAENFGGNQGRRRRGGGGEEAMRKEEGKKKKKCTMEKAQRMETGVYTKAVDAEVFP